MTRTCDLLVRSVKGGRPPVSMVYCFVALCGTLHVVLSMEFTGIHGRCYQGCYQLFHSLISPVYPDSRAESVPEIFARKSRAAWARYCWLFDRPGVCAGVRDYVADCLSPSCCSFAALIRAQRARAVRLDRSTLPCRAASRSAMACAASAAASISASSTSTSRLTRTACPASLVDA
jgi:hypothetical protein